MGPNHYKYDASEDNLNDHHDTGLKGDLHTHGGNGALDEMLIQNGGENSVLQGGGSGAGALPTVEGIETPNDLLHMAPDVGVGGSDYTG